MTDDQRSTLTITLWFLSAIVLAALFIAAAIQGELTAAHVAFASVLLLLATSGSVAIWRMKADETQPEKAKGRRLDSLLRDLSDDDLLELKHRLSAVDSDQQTLTEYLEDDGEIRQRR